MYKGKYLLLQRIQHWIKTNVGEIPDNVMPLELRIYRIKCQFSIAFDLPELLALPNVYVSFPKDYRLPL